MKNSIKNIALLVTLLTLISGSIFSQSQKFEVTDVTASATSNTLTSPLGTIDGKGAYDGDSFSRWSTYPTPANITYDLGEVKEVNKTRISFYYFDQGRIYNYSISSSIDNVNWNPIIVKASSSNQEYTVNEFEPTSARYIKIDLHSANNSKWATIWETEIYGISDLTAPEITDVQTSSKDSLKIVFSESVNLDDATNVSNYQIDNNINVLEALVADTNIVILNTTNHINGEYTLTVNNIKDLSGNSIAENFSKLYAVNFNEILKLEVKDVFASSTSNTLTSPLGTIDGKGAFDGDAFSRWSTYPTPANITYDLGEVKEVAKTRISFYYFDQGRIYNYSISTSVDNINWETVIENASSSDQEYTENEFASTNARYIKIDLHSANNSSWATIWETEIYGASDFTAPEIVEIQPTTKDSLKIVFSKTVNEEDAANVSNYQIDNNIEVLDAFVADTNIVILNTTNHINGEYTLTVNNIKDLAGISITENFSKSYTFELKEIKKLEVKDVFASSTSNTLTSPLGTVDGKGAFDGDATARWSTYPTPANITYDLGEVKEVAKTRISFYYFDQGRIYNYSISASVDNINWETVIENANSSNQEFTENEFASTNARYIKIDLHSANNSSWATIWETEIYGYETINTVSVNFNVSKGWNIVSLPVQDSIIIDSLFGDNKESNAFNYNEYYEQHDTIKSGLGYWVRFKQDTSFVVNGKSNNSSIELKEGWNMIGSFDSVLVEQLYTEPENILTTPFYGFEGNYVIADTMFNGKGYWVKAATAGTLHVGAKSLNKNSLSKTTLTSNDLISITINDSENNSMTLYLSDNNSSLSKIVLPPVPPKGVFDVRFTNGQLISSIADIQSQIKITDAVYPITITTNSNELIIKDNIDGTYVNESSSSSKSITIEEEFVDLISIEFNTLPFDYKLDQNYPNPFNPTTTINFSIPKTEKVTLAVYNVLGEKVTQLVNEKLNAGTHKVNFNANNIASGIYFYVLEAGSFIQTKKMTLLK